MATRCPWKPTRTGSAPARGVVSEIAAGENHAVDAQKRLGEGAAIDARRAFLGQRFEGLDEPGLHEQLARLQHPALADEEVGSALEREDVAEHDQ